MVMLGGLQISRQIREPEYFLFLRIVGALVHVYLYTCTMQGPTIRTSDLGLGLETEGQKARDNGEKVKIRFGTVKG